MTETSQICGTQAIAEALSITPQTATRLLRSQAISATRIGNRWITTKADIDNYLSSNNLTAVPADHQTTKFDWKGPVALSFFSGALGLDLGMERSGIHARLMCESEKHCRMTIDSVRPEAGLIGDINNYTAADIRFMAAIDTNTEVDVMFGGPPCQAFSTAGARRAFDDARGNIFLKYLDLAADIQPKYLVIENVRGLLSAPYPINKDGKPIKGGALSLVLKRLKKMGYGVSFNLYNAANFGAAQIRERVILIAKRDGSKMGYLTPTNSKHGEYGLPKWISFREVVDDLEGTPMHGSQFPEKRLKYFRMLKEGQYWKDLPKDVQPDAMGKAYALSGGKTGFFRRISFDKPCPTLVTSPTMPATDLCHPKELRPLSIEEYKRVQGFPDDWIIRGSITDVYRQIGNAVPIALGEALGKAILDDMAGKSAPARFEDFPYSRYKHTSDVTWEDPS